MPHVELSVHYLSPNYGSKLPEVRVGRHQFLHLPLNVEFKGTYLPFMVANRDKVFVEAL